MPAKSVFQSNKNVQFLSQLGVQIRAKRKHLNVTAKMAADAAGMSRNTWHRLEKGEASITIGSYLAAVDALGMALKLEDELDSAPVQQSLPKTIAVKEYPGLKQLAWHLQADACVTPQQALDLYERNGRHLDQETLTHAEKQLIALLQKQVH
ncbi:MAG: helix-turn-helix domain-containing protein [Gammaproteobacteria bacterium]|nr:helix-turn-helix domain-containing protein [Gammaproteobacteria bacterium]